MDVLEQNSPQLINQTYKIWKKNTPFLYSFLKVYQLPSCSQTIDWFNQNYIENDWEVNSVLIGSNSLTKNYVAVANVLLPTDQSIADHSSYQQKPQSGNIGTMGQQNLNIKFLIPQNSQVMKAKVNKMKQNIIACKTGGTNHELLIYNLNSDSGQIQQTKLSLSGHEAQGFGLQWHPKLESRVLSGSYDRKVLIWDLNKGGMQGVYEPIFAGYHSEGVEDVKWSANDNIFGSVGQDRNINIWDIRQNESTPAVSKQAHSGQIYCLDFNPFTEHLLLTGSEDSDIILWDTRNMSKKIHTFCGHNSAVNTIKFCPQHPLRFASGSSDRKVVIWDMSNLKPDDKSSNEIMFIHGGHRTRVTELSFHKNSYTVASCEQSKILQVWSMNQSISSQ